MKKFIILFVGVLSSISIYAATTTIYCPKGGQITSTCEQKSCSTYTFKSSAQGLNWLGTSQKSYLITGEAVAMSLGESGPNVGFSCFYDSSISQQRIQLHASLDEGGYVNCTFAQGQPNNQNLPCSGQQCSVICQKK